MDEILLKADSVTLAIEALKDGNLRVRTESWEDPRIVLPNQELVLRNIDGQVNIVRVTTLAPPDDPAVKSDPPHSPGFKDSVKETILGKRARRARGRR